MSAQYAIVGGRIHIDDIRNYGEGRGLGSALVDEILSRHPDLPKEWTAAMVKEGGAVFWERMRQTRGIDLRSVDGQRLPTAKRLREALAHPAESTMREDHVATVTAMRSR